MDKETSCLIAKAPTEVPLAVPVTEIPPEPVQETGPPEKRTPMLEPAAPKDPVPVNETEPKPVEVIVTLLFNEIPAPVVNESLFPINAIFPSTVVIVATPVALIPAEPTELLAVAVPEICIAPPLVDIEPKMLTPSLLVPNPPIPLIIIGPPALPSPVEETVPVTLMPDRRVPLVPNAPSEESNRS